jgi:hypothetical protein
MTRLVGATILVLGMIVADSSMRPIIRAAGEPKKAARDPRQTVEAYLAAVLSGKVEAAAALALPGSAEGSMERIAEYKKLIAAMAIKLASVHQSAAKGRAFVVTEVVPFTKQADGRDRGPLVIKLTKKDEHWLVRDVDFKTEEVAKMQLKDFLQRYPDAKPVPQKVEKK